MRAKMTKIKNDPSRYMTRKSLAIAAFEKSGSKRNADHVRREAAGMLDSRWYISLPSASAGPDQA